MGAVAGNVEVSGHARHHNAALQTAALLVRGDVLHGQISYSSQCTAMPTRHHRVRSVQRVRDSLQHRIHRSRTVVVNELVRAPRRVAIRDSRSSYSHNVKVDAYVLVSVLLDDVIGQSYTSHRTRRGPLSTVK